MKFPGRPQGYAPDPTFEVVATDFMDLAQQPGT
jgi:hypothetical protein